MPGAENVDAVNIPLGIRTPKAVTAISRMLSETIRPETDAAQQQ